MRQLFLAILLLVGLTQSALAAPASPGVTYAVVFEVSTDAQAGISDFKVSKVIDPASGSTDAVDIDVPDSFLAAAQNTLAEGRLQAGAHFFTYYFFDPGRPASTDVPPPRPR